ncbi:membrane protein [Agromyces luteolus]|uniref:HupE/UreJ family protein n=1 Tax=Agromyces luteolus TaxID=88373 RepID=A0A7C9LHT5_9MICO|nr:HupE/UreJ family protein [Agromyces luteolus]MUN07955.1 HupE/UreJ family protein [Agromyces luteolus]GLK28032.1 membrane protein [Agromyces luteolus]
MTHGSTRRRGPVRRVAATTVRAVAVIGVALAVGAGLAPSGPALAHDETTSAYAEVVRDGDRITAELALEYDLLLKSAWAYAEAYDATDRDEQVRQLAAYAESVDEYVGARFVIEADGARCAAEPAGAGGIRDRGDRAFAVVTYAYDCGGEEGRALAVSSALFPDAEGFVHSTRTMLEWDLDGAAGSAVLEAAEPTVELADTAPRVGEFFVLGAEHLLFGLDHVLFLVALLLGARTLHGLVLTATTFTVAHSVTFLLAATGVVGVPAEIVEPVIALSIAIAAVAATRKGEVPDRWRMPVVFAFGLLHGLGFASALGVDEAWSWGLLWSLLAFNVGIEAAQLAIIAVAFPLLVLLRRSVAGRPATVVAGLAVAAVGTFWFAERVIAGVIGAGGPVA